jgi:hypothetical protein
MNYLNYKKQFPKSIKLFFEWVSNRDENLKSMFEGYVDNIYFNTFFINYFDYKGFTFTQTLKIDSDKKYFHQLKSELVSRSLDENFCRFFGDNQIAFINCNHTNKEYIRIYIDSESSFESAFFVSEILIENAYYGSK